MYLPPPSPRPTTTITRDDQAVIFAFLDAMFVLTLEIIETVITFRSHGNINYCNGYPKTCKRCYRSGPSGHRAWDSPPRLLSRRGERIRRLGAGVVGVDLGQTPMRYVVC